uniref:Uncharacterized protein n=1 Tax=Engystomops pustulosus TaxID=76066 RepID=A0AAV6YJ28_ENGPU|nr:hypothetical protein GDO81_029239 [Engystomops pustulosus]KAG8535188.1 hypothetical protein GDO81_029239 [Engystomops pustulosus]KAG8535189.1 hypothetical protein GDO81_029239 [Engystomops pustulosus]
MRLEKEKGGEVRLFMSAGGHEAGEGDGERGDYACLQEDMRLEKETGGKGRLCMSAGGHEAGEGERGRGETLHVCRRT